MTYEEAPQGAFLIFVPWDTGGTLLKMKWQQITTIPIRSWAQDIRLIVYSLSLYG